MLKSLGLILIGLILFFIHKYTLQSNKEPFVVTSVIGASANAKIKDIIERMDYIKKYNNAVFDNLKSVVNSLLTLYYKYINDELIKIDDITFYKQQLDSIYEELSLNLPYKYHKRLKHDIRSLNRELNKKMELLKIKSFKNPIKISLMNYNYT